MMSSLESYWVLFLFSTYIRYSNAGRMFPLELDNVNSFRGFTQFFQEIVEIFQIGQLHHLLYPSLLTIILPSLDVS